MKRRVGTTPLIRRKEGVVFGHENAQKTQILKGILARSLDVYGGVVPQPVTETAAYGAATVTLQIWMEEPPAPSATVTWIVWLPTFAASGL